MSALQKLQEKIEQWRADHEALKSENAQLRAEVESLVAQKNEKEEKVAALENELEEKDAEIEKIIAQVETLLA